MGWRFRRSIKIAPGVRWNIGKRSTSFSFGPRGFKVTAGTAGVRQTVGLPGTGLSYTKIVSASGRAPAAVGQRLGDSRSTTTPRIDPARFGLKPSRAKRNSYVLAFVFLVASVAAFAAVDTLPQAGEQTIAGVGAVLFLASFVCLIVGLFSPSSHNRAQKELQRRLAQFRTEFSEAAKVLNQAKCLQLLQRRAELGLTEGEVGSELEMLQAFAELFDFEEAARRNGDHLPILNGHERIVGTDSCYFAAPAFLDKRGPDENGQLFLTNERIVFLGATLTVFPWKKVAQAQRDGSELVVQRNDRQNPYRFGLNTLSEALRAEFIAKNVLAQPPA